MFPSYTLYQVVCEIRFNTQRFPCLLYALRCRHLENAQAIIASAVILHNFLIDRREDEPVLPPHIQEKTFQLHLARGQINIGAPGRPQINKFSTRNSVIRDFFTN